MKFSIYKKLLSGFAIVIFLMIAANVYVLWQLRDVTNRTNQTFQNDVRSINLAKQIQTVLEDGERNAQIFLIRRDTTYLNVYKENEKSFAANADSMYESSPNAREVGLINRLRLGHKWLADGMNRDFAAKTDRGPDKARFDTLEALRGVIDALIQSNEADVSNSVAGVNDAMVRSSNVAWLITVGALLVALMVALLITGSIIRPIRALILGTENIARGIHEPIEVKSRDEMAGLAMAVNDMSTKLKQINDLKTEMLHHISHELRTPLQTMLSAEYLLEKEKRGPLNEEQLRLLLSIKEGIKKLTVFSNQFLDIQKIEHGSMEYNVQRINLLNIVTSVVDDATIIASQKEVAVTLSHENDLPEIVADAEKMAQVFSNLLSNAVKYTETGGTINVNVTRIKKGIRASVTDTGAGIPPDDLPRIFTKFYQAKNAKKGTGIGLALVKHLVEAHHGRINVESELGKGTTFTVEFPAAPPEVKHENSQPAVTEGTT